MSTDVDTPAASVISGLLARSWQGMFRILPALIPSIVMPIFFTVAFAGAFRGVILVPGFPTDNPLNWFAAFAALQTASFAALGSTFALGRDLEGGFYDRLLLAPVPRWSLMVSQVLYASTRAFIPLTIVLVVGTIGGLTFPGGFLTVVCLAVATVGVATIAALWGAGIIYRTKSQSAGGVVQIGIFIAMFLSTGTMPLELQRGWLPHVARWNPVTQLLKLARAGFLDPVTWDEVWPGLAVLAVVIGLLGVFAYRGFRTLQP